MQLVRFFIQNLKKEIGYFFLALLLASMIPFVFFYFCLGPFFQVQATLLEPVIFLDKLFKHIGIMFCAFLFMQATHLIIGVFLSKSLPGIHHKLKKHMLEFVQTIPLKEFRKDNSGDFEKNVSSFAEGFCSSIELIFFVGYPSILDGLCNIWGLNSYMPAVYFSFFFRFILAVVLCFLIYRFIIASQNKLNEVRSQQSGILTDIFNNMFVEKIFTSASRYNITRFEKIQSLDDKWYTKINVLLGVQKLILGMLNISTLCIFIIYICKSPLTPAQRVCFLTQSMAYTVHFWHMLVMILPTSYAIGRVTKSIKFMQQYMNTNYQNKLNNNNIETNNIKIFKSVKIVNLSFSHDQKPILNNLNLTFNMNGLFLIKASSGTGKSSLFSLLTKSIQAPPNTIFFDDQLIEDLNIIDIQNNLTLLPQEDFIYNDTIKENILIGRTVTDHHFTEICKLCKVDIIAEQFPNNYKHMCGSKGSKISGGQARRISFARALLDRKKIILIDEPFNNLDAVLIDYFCQVIHQISQEHIVITTVHNNLLDHLACKIINIQQLDYQNIEST